MYTKSVIRSWRTGRIISEIRDQERWLRKSRARDFNAGPAYQFLNDLRSVLAERGRVLS